MIESDAMCSSPPQIAVILVNYNTADMAIKAVDSVLERSHGGRGVHVHLVDNASPYGDAQVLSKAMQTERWKDHVTFYPEAENHGFGRGNNCVLERLATAPVPPEKVFLLNPDAYLRNEAVDILADFLETTPQAGIVGAGIENPGQGPAVAAFRFPGVISEFVNAASFGPVTRLLGRWNIILPADMPTGRVGWVAGAAVMMRFDVIRDLGFFDPTYFLYYEEVDLMLQSTRAGWDIWYVAEAQVAHVEGAATDVKSAQSERRRRPAYWYRSWAYYFLKNHGRAVALMAALAWVSGAALNHVVSGVRGRQPRAALNFYGDFWAFSIRPLLGLGEALRD